MELNDDVAQAVLDWYDSVWNLPPPMGKKPVLTPDTSLSTGKYPWARETGDEVMADYFSRFQVDRAGFDFLKYWPYERGIIAVLFRRKPKAPEPLTVHMLTESARAGRWLYDSD